MNWGMNFRTKLISIFSPLTEKVVKTWTVNLGIDLNFEPTFLLSYWRPFLKSQLSLKIVNKTLTRSRNIENRTFKSKKRNWKCEIQDRNSHCNTDSLAELMNLVSLLFSFRRFEKRLAFLQKSKSRVLTFKTSP